MIFRKGDRVEVLVGDRRCRQGTITNTKLRDPEFVLVHLEREPSHPDIIARQHVDGLRKLSAVELLAEVVAVNYRKGDLVEVVGCADLRGVIQGRTHYIDPKMYTVRFENGYVTAYRPDQLRPQPVIEQLADLT